MTTFTIYDPPMCCSTGTCGPEVDPTLAQFAGDLSWLKSRGVEVRRFNLSQEPARFVENPEVKALLERSGGDDLPAILVDDHLVVSGGYPTREQLAALAGIQFEPESAEQKVRASGLVVLGGAAPVAASGPCCEVPGPDGSSDCC